jgi:hypothetical protein
VKKYIPNDELGRFQESTFDVLFETKANSLLGCSTYQTTGLSGGV